jgi:RNA-directed DNA polymerase
MQNQHAVVFRALAAAWLSSEQWTTRALLHCSSKLFATTPSWLPGLCRRVRQRFALKESRQPQALFEFVRASQAIVRDLYNLPVVLREIPYATETARCARRWEIPDFQDTGGVARWLEVSAAELAWFSLVRREAKPGAALHYRCTWIAKKRGGARLIEAPKPRLAQMQRKVLRAILERVPLHDAAHGFRKGRSALTHAAFHQGQAMVLRLDLRDFFLSVSLAKVTAIFEQLGFPRSVARVLGQLCTHRTQTPCPAVCLGPYPSATDLQQRKRAEAQARTPHLPQGAPTSPALANLSAFRLDARLSAAANACGARYSRYADDLVFSGDALFSRSTKAFTTLVDKIVREEGFTMNHRKTFARSQSQQQVVGGLVVNQKPQSPRRDFDTLKAILHKCKIEGPALQNREQHPDYRAHLQGRIVWCAPKGSPRFAKLQALFAQVDWTRVCP